MGRLILHVPGLRDMEYRRALLADPATMAYNAHRGLGVERYDEATGCIDFPREDWRYWRQIWLYNEPNFYSALLRDARTDAFVGEVCYFYDGEHDAHTAGILIEAKHRGQGLCAEGLRALMSHAFETREEIRALRCPLEPSNTPAIRGYLRAGFHDFGMANGERVLIYTREDHERERLARI